MLGRGASFMDDVKQPAGTLRLWLAGGAILAVALLAFPFQYASLKLKLPMARWIPLLFHRLVARIMGSRCMSSPGLPPTGPC
jgi:hypothetical protein